MKIPSDSLHQRVALVTGAGSGLGKSAAKALAHAGAYVAAVGRTQDELDATVAEINRNGGNAIALLADISHSDQVCAAIEATVQRWGRLDIVFANAGINGVWAPLEKLSEADWDQTMNINLRGTFVTIKHAVPHMKAHGDGGSIIVTSSVNGTRMFSNTGATAYACSKAGQVALVKMLALELAASKIRINAICPGAIESMIDDSTEQKEIPDRLPVDFPDGEVPINHGAPGTSGQVAELVWFLASDASSHITGTEIFIDGGQSLLQG
ncbi:SDR family oxidoreductase [Phragmitibacter flavus]|uniref:SDR family oxidoreductase n=1 Tax=Phragmitibacter flavus TaxID=2576071 RepID=A0A5R8KCN9_9BACT|nr:SDR family NAD(P)-dependent oxidoreductase [Phragmitibacter flavus]TLD70053.1 SDR family oxidoreductase [Phragmitibacter flavus]